MSQTYLLESPPPRNSRSKPSPPVFGDFGAVPERLSGTVQREGSLKKKHLAAFRAELVLAGDLTARQHRYLYWRHVTWPASTSSVLAGRYVARQHRSSV